MTKILVRRDGLGGIEFFNKSRWDYSLDEREIATRRGLIRWIRHMSEKNWVTKEHLLQLIDVSNEVVYAPFQGK